MNWIHFEEPTSIFALAQQTGGACLAATEHGLWQFTGEGGNWNQVAPQFALVALTSAAACGKTWLIGSNGDIAISRDAGASWSIATLPVKAHVLGLIMSPAFDQDGIALAATAKDGVLRSADGGASWHAWNYGLLDLGVNAIAISPDFGEDTTCFAATDHAVFMSTNGGRAWQELAAPMDAGPFTALAIVKTGRGVSLHVGTEGNGLWSSNAPYEDWHRVKGLRADEINFLLSQPQIAATTSGMYSANGSKWRKLSSENDMVCLAVLDDGTLIAGTAGNGLWHGKA
jgi:photosystem II stability/assembly factor-like uncharacterized protein